MRTKLALLLAAGGLSLSACAGGVAVGAASPAYADGYYAGAPYNDLCWTNGWAGTFNYPYCGWYNGFFYPGSGGYMYDRNRQPHALTPAERNHWAGQAPTLSNGMHSPGPVRTHGSVGGSRFELCLDDVLLIDRRRAVSRPQQTEYLLIAPLDFNGDCSGLVGGIVFAMRGNDLRNEIDNDCAALEFCGIGFSQRDIAL